MNDTTKLKRVHAIAKKAYEEAYEGQPDLSEKERVARDALYDIIEACNLTDVPFLRKEEEV